MKEFRWNTLKDERLKRTRGVSFQELINSELIWIKEHPAKAHQNLMLFKYKGYIWVVPYVEEHDYIYL